MAVLQAVIQRYSLTFRPSGLILPAKHQPRGFMASSNLARELDRFVTHIDSMNDTLDFLMDGVLRLQKPSVAALRQFLSDKCEEKAGEGGKPYYAIPPTLLPRFRKLKGRSDRLSIAYRTLPRTFIVSLVSQFDAFVGRLVRTLYYGRPELLNSSDRTLTFKQLGSFKDMEAAREFVVEKEVDALLRKSHVEQFEWLENKFGVPLRKGLASWPTFVELTERRNLFVHCNGVVSIQYLEVCRSNGVKLPNDVEVGKELGVNKRYFRSSYECIYEIGTKLAHVLWRKVLPDERKKADGTLINTAAELIGDGRYEMAKGLLEFAFDTIRKFDSDAYRRMLIINRAQVYKWSGDEVRAMDILRSEDWSACDDRFALAVNVLEDKFDEAAALIVRVPESDISRTAYRDWPLFRNFQKSEAFLTAYEARFGEPFRLLDVEVSETTLAERPEDNRNSDDSLSDSALSA
jgi:hypothetical protein